MKKLLVFLFAPLVALGQVSPPPASTAEVVAGVVKNKYVSPYTLAQGGGGSTNGITSATATNIAAYQAQMTFTNAVYHNGTVTFYPTLESAVGAALANDYIQAAPEVHTISNALIVPVGATLDLRGATLNSWVAPLGTVGPTIIVRDNCRVLGGFVDLKLRGIVSPDSSTYQAVIGSHRNVNTGTATNVWVYDNAGIGETDCIFVRNTNRNNIVFTSCNYTSRWDALAFMEAAHSFSLYNCSLVAIGTNYIIGSGGRANCIAVEASATGSKVEVVGGSLICSNSTSLVIFGAGGSQYTLRNVGVTNLGPTGSFFLTTGDVAIFDGTSVTSSEVDDDDASGTAIWRPGKFVGEFYGNGAGLTNVPYESVNGRLWGTNATSGKVTNVLGGVSVGANSLNVSNGTASFINLLNTAATPRIMVGGNQTAFTVMNTNSIAGTNGSGFFVLDGTGNQTNSGNIQSATLTTTGNAIVGALGISGTVSVGIDYNGTELRTKNLSGRGFQWAVNSVNKMTLDQNGSLVASGSVTATNGFIATGNGVATYQNTNSITGTNGSGFFVLDSTGNQTNSGSVIVTNAGGANRQVTITGSSVDLKLNSDLFVNGTAGDVTKALRITAADGVSAQIRMGRNKIGWGNNYASEDTTLNSLSTSNLNLIGAFTVSQSVTATNGYFLPQLSAIPTSVDLRSSSGNTNWLDINLNGYRAAVKTNTQVASTYETNYYQFGNQPGVGINELTNVFYTNTWAAVNNRIVTNYFAFTTPRTGMYEVNFTYGTPTEGGGTTIDSSSYTTLFWTDPINGTVQSSDSFDSRTPASGFNKWEYDKSYRVWAKTGTLLVVSNWMQDSFDGGPDTKSTNFVGAFIWARP